MIVDESAVLTAALGRRMQVERVLATEPARALLDPSDPPPGTAVAPAPSPLPARWATLMPLGAVILARATGALVDGTLPATIDDVPLLLEWPRGGEIAPRPGQDFPLRVVAHRPTLVLQTVHAAEPARWSADTVQLQATPVRFETPWVARGEAPVDAAATLPADAPRRAPDPMPFAPLVLQGPAWEGQPMELVVRRERADDHFDNAALDQWCCEVVIDLPYLGRVAGHLSFSMQGLRVRLEADRADSRATLDRAAAGLATGFARAGLRLAGLSVGGSAVAADGTSTT